MTSEVIIGAMPNGERVSILPNMLNRHGLITGATGTGKTITLQVLTEQLSKMGVPVILSDVKGDLSGLTEEGTTNDIIEQRTALAKIADFKHQKFPSTLWDLHAKEGLPLRTTVSEFGPVLLARILDLNDTQSDIIQLIFRYADDHGLLLLDMKDLDALLAEVVDKADELQIEYGNISKASVGAIKRRLLNLKEAGAEQFFGEPALRIQDLLQTDFSGMGVVNIIDAKKLVLDKRLYSSFLIWLLSEIFENFEEVGDPEKPKLVFFFDEAHLLFDNAPKALIEKIEMVIRLVRSKGVGIFFVSQSPADIPPEILSQLGNKIQHGLRASSEKDRKVIKSVSQNYPSDDSIDIEKEITALGIGETLVSVLDKKGIPSMTKKVLNLAPMAKMGPISAQLRKELIEKSPLFSAYSKSIDRESAFEILSKRKEEELKEAAKKAEEKAEEKEEAPKRKSTRQGPFEAFFKSILRSFGSQIGRQIVRGILGSMKK